MIVLADTPSAQSSSVSLQKMLSGLSLPPPVMYLPKLLQMWSAGRRRDVQERVLVVHDLVGNHDDEAVEPAQGVSVLRRLNPTVHPT